MTAELTFDFNSPTLARFMLSDAPIRIIKGPLGSGKTSLCCYHAYQRMSAQAPDAYGHRCTVGFVIRNTMGDLQTSTIPTWNAQFEKLGFPPVKKSPPIVQDLSFIMGSTLVLCKVFFLALDQAEDVRRLRGINATWGILDEVKELPEAVVIHALGRVGRFPIAKDLTWSGIWGATNAPGEHHWLYRKAEKEKPDGWEFYDQPPAVLRDGDKWVVNPEADNLENLPAGYYERQLGASNSFIAVNLANEYGTTVEGRPVIEGYDDTRHVVPASTQLRRDLAVIVGLDFGLTPAAIIMQHDEEDDSWYWHKELVTDVLAKPGTERFAQHLLGPELKELEAQGYEVVGLWGDPAGSQESQTRKETPFAILRENNIYAFEAPTNDFELRCTVIAEALAQDRLRINANCTHVREGLRGSYCYRLMASSNGEPVYAPRPHKGPTSHPIEAGGYGMLGGGSMASVVANVEDSDKASSGLSEDEVGEVL